MEPTQHYSVNTERVVHETIDGETIIIQLDTGTYYSLAGAGAEIWSMLAAGGSTDEVVEELRQRYEGSPEEIGEATTQLVSELRREELLEESSDATGLSTPGKSAAMNNSNGARAGFERPTLKKYTDMEYFLLLDPIHEVDGIGWPNARSERTAP